MAHASTIAAAMFVIGQVATMAGCDSGWGNPAVRETAGIERGDGGVWVMTDGGGTWFMPSDPFKRPLRATPTLETFCMLRGGNLTGGSKYEEGPQGIWIGDVPMILGKHDYRDRVPEGAQLTYTFALPRDGADIVVKRAEKDGVVAKEVALTLTFERVDAVWAPASERVPMDDPYFLTRIDATGIESPECWSPDVSDSAMFPVTPCGECKVSGRDFFLCRDVVEHVEDCYAH